MLQLLFIVGCVALVAYIAKKILESGLFSKVQVVTTDNVKYLSAPSVVYYKHNVGHYKNSFEVMKEARSLLPKGATTFGIYYDSPDEVPEHLLQSAVGVVFSTGDEEKYTDNYAQQLTRWGFEKMTLPVIKRAVQAKQPYTGYLSLINLISSTYPAVKEYIKEHRLETSIALEFYEEDEVTVVFPLEHETEFHVPEYVSTDELESRLARRKFDSDESDSESEADPASNDEDNEDEAAEKSS